MRGPQIEIKFQEDFDSSSGVCSFSSWSSMKADLEKHFWCREGEEIVGIVVHQAGITAFFGKKRESYCRAGVSHD